MRCLVLVGLVALLYLWQVSAATNSAAQLQALQAEQSALQRQDAELHQQLGVAQSPVYIAQRARAMGLAPAEAGAVMTLRSGDDAQP